MRASRLWPVVAVVIAGAVVVATGPADGTEAQWRETTTATVAGPTSDTFEMTAADADAPLSEGESQNAPRVDLTSLSQRQTSWVDVRSARLTRAVPGDGNDILSKMALAYTFGSGACGGTTQTSYPAGRSAGQITEGTTYPRGATAVSTATLAPGASGVLCPDITLSYPETATGIRDTYLAHAGRAVDITTVLRQSTQAPATVLSTDRTIISRFRVGAPAPTSPNGSLSNVCRTETAGNQVVNGRFSFGWPNATTTATTTTAAMAGGWEIMRLNPATGAWETWASIAASGRTSAALFGSDIDTRVGSANTRQFVLRGYPFAGDKTRYVESDWIARAYNNSSGRNDRFVCSPSVTNPNRGPVNMP